MSNSKPTSDVQLCGQSKPKIQNILFCNVTADGDMERRANRAIFVSLEQYGLYMSR